MGIPTDSGLFINYVMSCLLKKIIVPSDFHNQVVAVKEIQEDDITGLVDSLTDLSVNTASVNFTIETDNEKFTEILKKWLELINLEYNGQIPTGINPLAEEYFKERWKYSSFPILKITKWGVIDGLILPTKMFFVDGGSVHSKDKNEEDDDLQLINYDYYLGKESEEPLDKNVIITKPYGRWFDEYPTPYLIKRGVYHNWKIIQSIKNKESEILDQIIPYMLLVKKGSEQLATQNIKTYSNEELKAVIGQFEDLVNKLSDTTAGTGINKTAMRATNFDEEIKHLIPDLSAIFDTKLFAQAEKNILAGLGFVDIAEAISTSRRESILNPKAFIEEAKAGVKSFKQIMKELVILIKEKNNKHKKYVNSKIYIVADPIKGFMTDDFKEKLRQLYDRGLLSKQTTTELIGEVDFRTEIYRRDKETVDGLDAEMYPPVRDNREGVGVDIPSETPKKPKDTEEEEIPDDKKDSIEKQEYNAGKKEELEGAPYKIIKELPARVKNNLTIDLQRVFLRVFNNAFNTYQNETRAFRIAWGVIKKLAKKGKNKKWHRISKKVDGKRQKAKLTRAMIEEVIEKEEKDAIEGTLQMQKLEINEKQTKLLNKLLDPKKE